MAHWGLFTALPWHFPTWPRPVLPGSRLLLFHNYWGHCAPGSTQCFRNGFIPLSRSAPQHKVISQRPRETRTGHGCWVLPRYTAWVVEPWYPLFHVYTGHRHNTAVFVISGLLNWPYLYHCMYASYKKWKVLVSRYAPKNVTVLGFSQVFSCLNGMSASVQNLFSLQQLCNENVHLEAERQRLCMTNGTCK